MSLKVQGLSASRFGWHAQVCKRKSRFHSKQEAKSWARVCKSRFDSKQRPYLCEVCDRWHLRTVEDTQD